MLICALSVAHVTGLRNTLVVLACVATFAVYDARTLLREPVIRWLAAFVGYAALSLTWSAAPAISWSKLQSDLLLPLAGFCAAFVFVRQSIWRNALFNALFAAAALLALLSLFNWLPTTFPAAVFGISRVTQSVALNRPMPIWYPGVGDASMFVAVAFGPMATWCLIAPGDKRIWAALSAVTLFTIALATSNRNVLAAMPFAAVSFGASILLLASRGRHFTMGSSWIRKPQRVVILIVAGAVIALLLAGALVELASREIFSRAGDSLPSGSSAVALSADDSRPAAWRAYIALGASQHPLVGAGYGRTVPAIEYRLHDDPTFANLDPALRVHAHNFFLDLWLQLGVIGVAILIGVFASLLHRSIKLANANPEFLYPACGVVATIFYVALRNLTDDFMVYSGAESFWIVLGMLSGFHNAPHISSNPSCAEEPR
jgi:hypothetical protein